MERNTASTITNIYAILAWIGSLFLLIVGLGLVFGGSLFGFMMSAPVTWMMDMPTGMAGGILGAVAVAVGVFLVLLAVLYFFVGLAIWRRQAWGRIAAIVLGVLELASFPVGTIIGAFAIWFFGFSPEGKEQFSGKQTVAAANGKKKR